MLEVTVSDELGVAEDVRDEAERLYDPQYRGQVLESPQGKWSGVGVFNAVQPVLVRIVIILLGRRFAIIVEVKEVDERVNCQPKIASSSD